MRIYALFFISFLALSAIAEETTADNSTTTDSIATVADEVSIAILDNSNSTDSECPAADSDFFEENDHEEDTE